MSRPIAFITGANQGIGLATARILAETHSYHVIIGSRSLQAGEKVASELRDAGHEASTVQLDLSSPTSIEAAIATINREFGYLDVLVNNAGILIDLDPSHTTWDLYTKTFNTNVIGTAVLTEGLLPLLREAKFGPPRIVFVTSMMGSLKVSTDKTTPFYNLDCKAYDASKAAVNMLMLNYARVLGGSGKVNAVCPGLVKTNLTGFDERGHSPEIGASRIVELAVLGEGGPTGTLSDRNGPLPW
ncbi:Fc.00g054930.m01.CDS01 [Cosmosporella sp. VM-42]